MGSYVQHFQECGWPSWLVLLAALLAVVVTAVAFSVALLRIRWASWLAWVAFVLALAPLGVGGLGVALGRAKVDALVGIGAIDPSQLARIRDEGYREAGRCIEVGGAAAALPILLSMLALGVAYGLRKPAEQAAK